jgi:two-component system nitrogen regulation sensor histidine kinase NtrY
MVSDTSNQAVTTQSRKYDWRDGTGKPLFFLGLILVGLSLISALTTYLVLTGLTPILPTHSVVVTVLLINGVFALGMISLIAWQVTGLWIARRQQAAGARLHVRIVSLFSIIAVLPAILLAIFASLSLDRGLDHWFSKRTKSIIKNSVNVATAYLNEHGQVIRADVISMADDLDEAVNLVRSDPQIFGRFLTAQATIRSIPVAYLINSKLKLLASAGLLFEETYAKPPPGAIEAATEGKAVIIAPGKSDKVAAIKKLDNFTDTYLYIVRPVNPKVLQHLRNTRAQVKEYRALAKRQMASRSPSR